MPSPFSIELQGTTQLQDFFKDLPRQFTTQVLGDIAQKGASVIRSEARRQMPVDGELGRIGKKAVVIARNKENRTERAVTIGNQYVTLRGKEVSIGRIIRHMTAGRQNLRKTSRGFRRGKVAIRGGDFIQRAFERRKALAITTMGEATFKIIERRALRAKGIQYGR